MSSILAQEIKYLPGVGPKRAAIMLQELKINTVAELLYLFPYKYIDRTKFYKIREINETLPFIQIQGVITGMETVGEGRSQRMVANFYDGENNLELVWFRGIKFVQTTLKKNTPYIVFGKPTEFNNKWKLVHPELEEVGSQTGKTDGFIQPFYNTSEKMKSNFLVSKTILKFQQTALQLCQGKIPETLPGWLLQRHHLITLETALLNIHFPTDPTMLRKAEFRLKFEELFYIQLKLLHLKHERQNKFKGHIFKEIGSNFNGFFHNHLPFELTGAQKRVIREIRKDTLTGKQMNRLLQGDVGSGKTMVALMISLIAMDNGFQSCMMAPTEILAMQHYQSVLRLLGDLPVNVRLLTGSTPKSARQLIHQQLLEGSLNLLIGTHALLEDVVEFRNLGMVVIDEQHRFGVMQRAKMWRKNFLPPHVLVMTATPIPRTLAMTVYGDLDISVIDELPPGRKPIRTFHYYDNHRAELYQFIRKQISLGRQIYMVYPLIKESEKLDFKNLEEGYEQLRIAFPHPEYTISMVHGKMKAAAKEEEMRRFKNHESQILVATTVIEVGVDVPNASVMVIESAERFGLSQLHQLRGRVGRGADQSFCILMSSVKLSHESRQRLETMTGTNDGFEIAEADMRLRGPGDLEGTQQSGLAFDLRISNLAKDGQILQMARDQAEEILGKDALLQNAENQILTSQLLALRKNHLNWGAIS